MEDITSTPDDSNSVTTSSGACYGSGSLAAGILLTFFFTVGLIAVLLYLWYRRQRRVKDNHLILESDPEKGQKSEYAFDNHGFKDTTLVAVSTTSEKNSTKQNETTSNSKPPKWTQWAPLSGFHLKSSEKKRTLDDSYLENQVKVVALKSQDFTGLGFTIYGNMKEGIYIKDILHRGPAFESGKLSQGDRINSVTISFEHMVYEDALNILSYASPYEVIIEAKSGRTISTSSTHSQGQHHQTIIHPIYKSSSLMNLFQIPDKSSKKKLLFGASAGDDHSSSSNYSSLQKSRSNMTTLERKESKSPLIMTKNMKVKKSPLLQKLTPELSKTHLDHANRNTDELIIKAKTQRAENIEPNGINISPKLLEQNQNNINIERNMDELALRGIDEVDQQKLQVPLARKREKKTITASPEPASADTHFERHNSGIKRDKDGIPLEIPNHMFDAAVAARRNRKGMTNDAGSGATSDDAVPIKKSKAPQPPLEENLTNEVLPAPMTKVFDSLNSFGSNGSSDFKYGSDSEEEDQQTSSSLVNTIELDSNDITIHHHHNQGKDQEQKARKTASTGDLSKMKKISRANNSAGTLERAQSLDITDTSSTSPTLMNNHNHYDATENLLIDREPRLSLILDGLNTFQKNCLKKSTEWGNLEDAILSINGTDAEWQQRQKSEPQFNAVMDRINQIKRDSGEMVIETSKPKIINKIWPGEEEFNESMEIKLKQTAKLEEPYMKRQQVPPAVPERNLANKKSSNEAKSQSPYLNLSNSSNTNILIEYESSKPIPPKRERISEPVINLSSKGPVTLYEKNNVAKTCSEIVNSHTNPECQLIKDEWEFDALNNISPPQSMSTLVDEVMDSYYNNAGGKNVTVTPPSPPSSSPPPESLDKELLKEATADFIVNEKSFCDSHYQAVVAADTQPQLVSHVTVSDGNNELHSLELSINSEPNEILYTTALDSTIPNEKIGNEVTVIVSKPDKVTIRKMESNMGEPVVEITESSFSKVTKPGLETIPIHESVNKHVKLTEGENNSDFKVEITESKYSTFELPKPALKQLHLDEPLVDSIEESSESREDESSSGFSNDSKQTYVTEIQVLTPNNGSSIENLSEINDIEEVKEEDHKDQPVSNYIKDFESKLEAYEHKMENLEHNLDEFIRDEPKSIVLEDKSEAEKEMSKIHEIVEQQLKTLPEMRFSTSSYETGRKTPEKRHSFELLRSSFEKGTSPSPGESRYQSMGRRDSSGSSSGSLPRSRIPISTTMKTPPMSPERRDSRNLENENDRAILELMSSPSASSNIVHSSTPFTSKIKPPSISSKNISVTSIKNNSKIPSGLPTLAGKPPIVPRKSEESLANNGGVESSFKQWVFNPNGNVTNVTVGKEK